MATWDAFYPYILASVRGCDTDVVDHHVRQAAITFFARSQAWRTELSGIVTEAGTEAYSFATSLPTDSVISRLLSIAVLDSDGLADDSYDIATPEDGRSLDRNQVGESYAFLADDLTTISIAPVPTDSGFAIVPYVSLRPTQASASIPDWLFEQYVSAIANGALSTLLAMGKVAWTDKAEAADKALAFKGSISSALGKVSRGSGRARRRSRGTFY
jgi:hypothetical protein